MPQQPVELILTRQLASCLTTPAILVDAVGTLLFYNEPAEALLGLRYDEMGELPLDEWIDLLAPTDDDGDPVPAERRPLVIALREGRPTHHYCVYRTGDGDHVRVAVTALPLEGHGGRHLGALAIVWPEEGP